MSSVQRYASALFYAFRFCFGMIMPLLKDKHGDATKIDMYRGITLSCVVSKLFESVLVVLFEDFL